MMTVNLYKLCERIGVFPDRLNSYKRLVWVRQYRFLRDLTTIRIVRDYAVLRQRHISAIFLYGALG